VGTGGVGDGGRGSSGRGLRRGGSGSIGMVTEAATGSCSGGWALGQGGRSLGAAWAAAARRRRRRQRLVNMRVGETE
jgi:hypothetical protein